MRCLALVVLTCMALARPLGAAHSAAQQHASLSAFFSKIDADHDGQLSAQEAEAFLRDFSGREEGWTREQAAAHMQAALDTADEGTTVSEQEVELHLHRLGLLQDHQVAEWVRHALNLPQYAAAFKSNAITALDFPLLADNGGDALRRDLGISSGLHRAQVLRALRRVILGVGQPPSEPRGLACAPAGPSSVRLRWEAPAAPGHPPMHKYVLRRQRLGGEGHGGERWELAGCPDDEDTAWVDFPPASGRYQYRLEAWNAYGRSAAAAASEPCLVRASNASAAAAAAAAAQVGGEGGWASWAGSGSAALLLVSTLLRARQVQMSRRQQQQQQQQQERPEADGSEPAGKCDLQRESSRHCGRSLSGASRRGSAVDLAGGVEPSHSYASLPGSSTDLPGLAAAAPQGSGETSAAAAAAGDAPAGAPNGRCAHPGCHRRFDRLRDIKRSLQNHYCGLCQRVYCAEHTRVAPHGPLGGCGLDSACICGGCFAEFPSEQRAALLRTNRLPERRAPGGGAAAVQDPPQGGLGADGDAAGGGDGAAELESRTARRRWQAAGTALRAALRLRAKASQRPSD